MKLHIVTHALPPKLDGIADYTALLALELARTEQVTILTDSTQTFASIKGVQIRGVFDPQKPATVTSIAEEVRRDPPDWLLLQYNPFNYGRWGLNLALPRVMRRLARSTNVAVMFHERYYAPIRNLRTAAMVGWQRYQFRRLTSAARVVLFSTDTWVEQFNRRHPNHPAFHLPVGSNIPRVANEKSQARRNLGFTDRQFIVGMFGSAHVSRMIPWVRDATLALRNAGLDAVVLYLGPDVQHVTDEMQGVPLRCTGPLDPADVSRNFAAVDLHACPILDGASTRRGSFLMGLEHQVATVSTCGPSTGPLLRSHDGKSFLLVPTDDRQAFIDAIRGLAQDPTRREQIASQGRQLFTETFAWEKLVARLLAILNG